MRTSIFAVVLLLCACEASSTDATSSAFQSDGRECDSPGDSCSRNGDCCGFSIGARCVNGVQSSAVCAAGCSRDSDCKSGCCSTLSSGDSVCLPSNFCQSSSSSSNSDQTCRGYGHVCAASIDCCGALLCKDNSCG